MHEKLFPRVENGKPQTVKWREKLPVTWLSLPFAPVTVGKNRKPRSQNAGKGLGIKLKGHFLKNLWC